MTWIEVPLAGLSKRLLLIVVAWVDRERLEVFHVLSIEFSIVLSFGSIVYYLWIRSQMKQEDPLNLSILLRGGKETNKDSPSNGEWSGNSSNLKSHRVTYANCNFEKRIRRWSGYKFFGTRHQRGWESRIWSRIHFYVICFLRVGLFGNADQNGW